MRRGGGEGVEGVDFAVEVGHQEGLEEGERGHAVQEFEGGEVEAGGLDAVGDDGFDGGEDGAEEGHAEAEGGVVVVSVGG